MRALPAVSLKVLVDMEELLRLHRTRAKITMEIKKSLWRKAKLPKSVMITSYKPITIKACNRDFGPVIITPKRPIEISYLRNDN